MENLITKTVALSLKILEEYIKEGDIVIDATSGNGHDTLALAKLVGSTGIVYAFDIQESAIENTRALLEKEGLAERCRLILASHIDMKKAVPSESIGKIAAVIFNLGYLPGGDKDKTTCSETTLTAVKQALELIRPGGIAAITIYSGHSQGILEKEAMTEFATRLSQIKFHAVYISYLNQSNHPPEILLITKKYDNDEILRK